VDGCEHSAYGVPLKPIADNCQHLYSDLDIVAIKLHCCDKFYPCFSCHKEAADHEPGVWPKAEFNTKAILCGGCGTELSITIIKTQTTPAPTVNQRLTPVAANIIISISKVQRGGSQFPLGRKQCAVPERFCSLL
jgi:uncharacterized CHY-type Zn-finger protein